MAHVLVVDDDVTVTEVVSGYLRRAGHTVAVVHDGPAVFAEGALPADLVVLDVMLPGWDGIEVCRRLRLTSDVPVIMLTALGAEVDRVLGLEVGADDYLTKPFSSRELVLRVASVLRRQGLAARGGGAAEVPGAPAQTLVSGPVVMNPAARTVTLEGLAVRLTLRETDLLLHLLRHPGQVFSREDLLAEVWGWDFGDQSTVTVHVRRLRHKIETDPAQPGLLTTVWGIGYRWDAPVTIRSL